MFCVFKNEKGVTLIEIIVVIFIIAIFSLIIIADFPGIEKQYALSNATYKLAQDFRRVQDLGLSGIQLLDADGNQINVQGYGIYINPAVSDSVYLIYADVGDEADQRYTGDFLTDFSIQILSHLQNGTFHRDKSSRQETLQFQRVQQGEGPAITGKYTILWAILP